MTERKRGAIAAILAASLGFIVLIGCLLYGLFTIKADHTENLMKLESSYQNSFYELSEGVSSIESNLSKMMVSVSDTESALLAAENYRNAQAAIRGLSNLPMDRETTKSTAKFLNQVGDWSNSMSKAVASGADISSYREQVEDIYVYTAQLNSRITDMISLIKDDYLIIDNVGKEKLSNFDYNERSVDPSAEYPELIYDGPYSDAAKKDSFGELSALPEVSEVDAIKVLLDAFEGIQGITRCGTGTSPKCYMFTGKIGETNIFAAVSVNGGKILSVNTDRTVTVARYNEDGVIRLAKKMAADLGYGDLTEVWYNEVDGIATVNLVPEVDGVICYTDLVKVKLGLDGKFIGFEATGYCKCHKDRSLAPTMSASAAAQCVSDRLKISNIRLALVPKDSKEVLCYEVAATFKGLRYFVYVDAHNGNEVEIMRVTEQGGQGKMVS
ncbi:MAG: germination protein YpeB [Clostridiales bacterium]|nr:germination protein YpeB [Clostridiales bacterium]